MPWNRDYNALHQLFHVHSQKRRVTGKFSGLSHPSPPVSMELIHLAAMALSPKPYKTLMQKEHGQ